VDDGRELATAWIDGVLSADALAVAECFAPDGRLRALIPPGPTERRGANAAGELIASWFVDADPLMLIDQSVDRVADRLHISYRLDGTELDTDFMVQQQVYAEVIDGRFMDVTLLCSGFRPRTA